MDISWLENHNNQTNSLTWPQGQHSLTWINFNPSILSNYIHCKACDEITLDFQTSTEQLFKFGSG